MIFAYYSKWNGVVNWQKALAQRLEGAYLKATGSGDGGNYVDYKFPVNSAACPLKFKGGYHYFDYRGRSGADQCKFFLDTCGDWGNLRGVLDMEDNAANWGVKLESVIGVAMREALAWVNQYRLETGHDPVLYLNTELTVKKQYVLSALQYQYIFRNFLGCPLWVANYNDIKNPLVNLKGEKSAWPDYALWQYTSKGPGRLYGNEAGNAFVDLNIVKNLQALLKPGVTVEDEPVVVSPAAELSDSEKVSILWGAHPELHPA